MKKSKKFIPPEITEIRIDRDISMIMMSLPPNNPDGPGGIPIQKKKREPLDSPFGNGW